MSLRILAAAVFLLPIPAQAQVYPWWGDFEGPCILPRQAGEWVIPFTGINLRIDSAPENVLATFPLVWQGRNRIGVGMEMRVPGMTMRFNGPRHIFGESGLQFDPPGPWQDPIDSLKVTWESPSIMLNQFGNTVFTSACLFHVFADEPTTTTAYATVNLVGFYASASDTVTVWGIDFGWPDLLITAQRDALMLPVEEATWGGIKARWNSGE